MKFTMLFVGCFLIVGLITGQESSEDYFVNKEDELDIDYYENIKESDSSTDEISEKNIKSQKIQSEEKNSIVQNKEIQKKEKSKSTPKKEIKNKAKKKKRKSKLRKKTLDKKPKVKETNSKTKKKISISKSKAKVHSPKIQKKKPDNKPEIKDRKSHPEKAEESTKETFVNPFASDENPSDASLMNIEHIDLNTPLTQNTDTHTDVHDIHFILDDSLEYSSSDSDIENEDGGVNLDFLIDLYSGINISRFIIDPEYIKRNGQKNILIGGGVIVPFWRWLYAGVSVNFSRISSEFSFTYTAHLNGTFTNTKKSKEVLTFLSVPIQVGMRFGSEHVVPYFYAELKPALLTSAYMTSTETNNINFDNSGPIATSTFEKEIDITKKRERHQVFVGLGVGIEVSYGYGSVYINGALSYSIRDVGSYESLPLRKTCRIIHFPITIGLRFFL